MTRATLSPMQQLLHLLELESLEVNLFRAPSLNLVGKNVFGGQVLGQSLMAAGKTLEGRPCHSLHGYFLRSGDPKSPIVYQVDRIRDGKSFSTREVRAIQHGETIFILYASFQVPEDGLEHQRRMPDVPGPEGILNETELRQNVAPLLPEKVRNSFVRERPIELRPINPVNPFAPVKQEPLRHTWFRAQEKVSDDIILHQSMLAFASDFGLMGTAMLPHGVSFMHPNLQGASLDHAMWFHHDFRIDDWLLYEMDSPWSGGSRGMNRGSIFRQDGILIATVAQEGLMRLREVADT